MIETLRDRCGFPCRGGFLAYYNEMSLYTADPAAMFSRAIAVLIAHDGSVLACPVDLTRPERLPAQPEFCRIGFDAFGTRSTGALFARGCYFSIASGPLAGAYQISDDRIDCPAFPSARAYRRYLLQNRG